MTDSNQWYLYLAMEGINDTNLQQGYGELLQLALGKPNPYLDPFQIKLISVENPLARDVIEITRRYPGHPGFHYNWSNLGGMGIDGAYLYPVSDPVPVQPG